MENRMLVVSAGMPRSGSTLLFNILRELMRQEFGDRLVSGWIGDLPNWMDEEVCLVKVHELSPLLLERSSHIFYTYRDLRSAAVSAMRVFRTPLTMEIVRDWVKEYLIARSASDTLIRYEELVSNTRRMIGRCARLMDSHADLLEVEERLSELKLPVEGYSRETLLHFNHITHTEVDDWKTELPEELREQICSEFGWWLKECGYDH